VVCLRENPPLYLLRPTPTLRLFLARNEEGEIEIQDLMGEEQYQWFRSLKS
jgi:hypothetical protein